MPPQTLVLDQGANLYVYGSCNLIVKKGSIRIFGAIIHAHNQKEQIPLQISTHTPALVIYGLQQSTLEFFLLDSGLASSDHYYYICGGRKMPDSFSLLIDGLFISRSEPPSYLEFNKTLAVPPDPSQKCIVCGPQGSGKSTAVQHLLNYFISEQRNQKIPQGQKHCSHNSVCLIDLDLGQPMFGAPGLVSLSIINSYVFYSPSFLDTKYLHPHMSWYFGDTTQKSNPELYHALLSKVFDYYNENFKNIPLIVNTSGWISGIGLHALKTISCYITPTIIFQFESLKTFQPSLINSNESDSSILYLSSFKKPRSDFQIGNKSQVEPEIDQNTKTSPPNSTISTLNMSLFKNKGLLKRYRRWALYFNLPLCSPFSISQVSTIPVFPYLRKNSRQHTQSTDSHYQYCVQCHSSGFIPNASVNSRDIVVLYDQKSKSVPFAQLPFSPSLLVTSLCHPKTRNHLGFAIIRGKIGSNSSKIALISPFCTLLNFPSVIFEIGLNPVIYPNISLKLCKTILPNPLWLMNQHILIMTQKLKTKKSARQKRPFRTQLESSDSTSFDFSPFFQTLVAPKVYGTQSAYHHSRKNLL